MRGAESPLTKDTMLISAARSPTSSSPCPSSLAASSPTSRQMSANISAVSVLRRLSARRRQGRTACARAPEAAPKACWSTEAGPVTGLRAVNCDAAVGRKALARAHGCSAGCMVRNRCCRSLPLECCWRQSGGEWQLRVVVVVGQMRLSELCKAYCSVVTHTQSTPTLRPRPRAGGWMPQQAR